MTAATSVRIDPRPVARWRPIYQWAACIPHLLWSGVLTALAVPLAFASAIAIIITGRPPQHVASIQALVLRERVRAYTAFFVLRDGVGPIAILPSLGDPGDDPLVAVDVVLPERIARSAVLARPPVAALHLMVLLPLAVVMDACYPLWMLVAAANGGWPHGLVRFLVRVERWVGALFAYLTFLSDDLPPFGLRANAADDEDTMILRVASSST